MSSVRGGTVDLYFGGPQGALTKAPAFAKSPMDSGHADGDDAGAGTPGPTIEDVTADEAPSDGAAAPEKGPEPETARHDNTPCRWVRTQGPLLCDVQRG
jgi:hypothetical protein